MTGPRAANVQPIPEGYHVVTPWIISRDSARLIESLSAAFGAEGIARVVVEDGSIGHAEVRIGDSVVMMFDAKPRGPRHPGRRASGTGCCSCRARIAGTRRRTGCGSRVKLLAQVAVARVMAVEDTVNGAGGLTRVMLPSGCLPII
jgi:hypothetical protein